MEKVWGNKYELLENRNNEMDLGGPDSEECASIDHMHPCWNGTRRRWGISVGSTTIGVDADGPLFVDPDECPTTVVTTEDAVMAPITGVEEDTQTVGIVKIKVIDTL